jgi:hypothetical protein
MDFPSMTAALPVSAQTAAVVCTDGPQGLPAGLRMPHPDAMNRIANYCTFCERDFLSLHVTYVLFPELISTDEERVSILKNDPMQRFKVKVEENAVNGKLADAHGRRYYVGLTAGVSEADLEVIKGVSEWKEAMAKFLKTTPGQSIPLTNLISECPRPASVSRELRIKDALRVDLRERFDLLGHSDMLYVTYRLSPQENETTKENWRNNMEKFLVLSNMKKVPLSTLGSSVPKPLLLKKSMRLLEVIDEDPRQRFKITESDNYSNVAYIGLVIDELERAKEKWRLRLAMQLASPPHQCAMTTLGGAVPRPIALGRNVTLMEVINTDPKNRFEIGGSSPQMFVRLTNIPGRQREGSAGDDKGAGTEGEVADGGWTVVGAGRKNVEGIEGDVPRPASYASVGTPATTGNSVAGGSSASGGRSSGDGPPSNVWASSKGLANVTRPPPPAAPRGSYAATLQNSQSRAAPPQPHSTGAVAPARKSVAVVTPPTPPAAVRNDPMPLLPPGLSGAASGSFPGGSGAGMSWGAGGGWGGLVGTAPPVHNTLGVNNGGLDVDDDGLDLGNLLSDYIETGNGALDSLSRDFFAPMDPGVFSDEEVMPSFLKKEKSVPTPSVMGIPNPASVSPPVSRTGGAHSMFLAEWLPEVLEGFPPPLISSFCEKLGEEGFIRFVFFAYIIIVHIGPFIDYFFLFCSAQDLLDAQALNQLTADFLKEACGFKLGHYNRLMKGLSSL